MRRIWILMWQHSVIPIPVSGYWKRIVIPLVEIRLWTIIRISLRRKSIRISRSIRWISRIRVIGRICWTRTIILVDCIHVAGIRWIRTIVLVACTRVARIRWIRWIRTIVLVACIHVARIRWASLIILIACICIARIRWTRTIVLVKWSWK